MKITNTTKLTAPVYSRSLKGVMFFTTIFMTAFSAFIVYMLIIRGPQEESNEFWLIISVMISITFICILSTYALMRNEIIVDNGQITWGYLGKHTVYIDDISAITDFRSVNTLHGTQFITMRFSDRKGKTYTLTVNSIQGKEFLDSMNETFGKPD